MRRFLRIIAVLGWLVAGCGTTAEATNTTSTTSTTAASTTTTPPLEADIFAQVEASWQGEITTIALHHDGRLVAGDQVGLADFGGPFYELASPADYESTKPFAKIEVIALGADDHPEGIMIATPIDEGEDPSMTYQVFVSDGPTLRRVFNRTIGVYGITPLVPMGDGTLEYQEDDWTACLRGVDMHEVNRQIVTLGFLDDGSGEIGEIGREDSNDTFRCENLSG